MARKNSKEEDDSFNEFLCLNDTSIQMTMAIVILSAILIRILVSLGPYSGMGSPPMYGDYEAQRHWMEITLHTPIREWYRNTIANNLTYWGLDYPPLTAYQSFAHGFLLNSSIPESLALATSHGFESHESKLLMRWTVLVSDFLVFMPAAVWFTVVYCKRFGGSVKKGAAPWLLAMILFNPCLILIDHGHFQYNCLSLGLTLGAIAAIFSRQELIASVLFSLAINHKQMSVYYAPAFFSHLLGKCLKKRNWVLEVAKLGLVVIGTFFIIWWPYLYSMDAVKEVLYRLAPFERGIYEDYVANFWCTTSVIIKWKQLFSISSLKFLSLISTIFALFPSFYQQIKAPNDRGFLYGLLNSSFAFYLFSYQVHEKTILLPLLPASLLALEDPFIFGQLVLCGLLSMFPLLFRDNLTMQYAGLFALFGFIYASQNGRNLWENKSLRGRILIVLPSLVSLLLHLIYIGLMPPRKYPFLFEAFIMLFCFSQFTRIAIWTNVQQWSFSDSFDRQKSRKKVL